MRSSKMKSTGGKGKHRGRKRSCVSEMRSTTEVAQERKHRRWSKGEEENQ